MVLLDTRMPAPQCNRRNEAMVIGVRLARRIKALSSLGVVLHGLPGRKILNMSGVSMLPHKSADDGVNDVQIDINIPTGHPCPMHPNYLPSDIFRYSSPWHIKIVSLSNLLSPSKNHTPFFEIIPYRFSALTQSGQDTLTAWNTVWISRCPCII